MNRTVLLLVVALVLSLSLNALFWFSEPSTEALQHAHAPDVSAEADASVVEDEEDEIACWVELADCRADAVEEGAMTAQVFTNPDAAMESRAGAAEPELPTLPREVDVDFQEEVLCTIALDSLRREWESQRQETIDNLRRSLADDDERGAMLERDVLRAQQLFEISESEREAFESDYRRLWEARVSEFREAIEMDPPNGGAAFAIAKELFQDEDELVTTRFGDDGRRRLRVAQAERRTAVLALLAVHAAAEWDEGISW